MEQSPNGMALPWKGSDRKVLSVRIRPAPPCSKEHNNAANVILRAISGKNVPVGVVGNGFPSRLESGRTARCPDRHRTAPPFFVSESNLSSTGCADGPYKPVKVPDRGNGRDRHPGSGPFLDRWQNGYCTRLENVHPQGLGGSSPSLSAIFLWGRSRIGKCSGLKNRLYCGFESHRPYQSNSFLCNFHVYRRDIKP